MRFASLGLAAASMMAGLAFLPAAASAAPGTVAAPAHASDVQPIAYCSRKAWRRGLCGHGSYVRAPFTEVDTNRGTWVAAPFVRVYSGRHGTWVRAPFVNLWNPH